MDRVTNSTACVLGTINGVARARAGPYPCLCPARTTEFNSVRLLYLIPNFHDQHMRILYLRTRISITHTCTPSTHKHTVPLHLDVRPALERDTRGTEKSGEMSRARVRAYETMGYVQYCREVEDTGSRESGKRWFGTKLIMATPTHACT